jgi:hypothetical protein
MLVGAMATMSAVLGGQDRQARAAFVVVGAQFHQRDAKDAGEARICIQNNSRRPLSMAQLRVRILAEGIADREVPTTEHRCICVKLAPPVLRPGQYGEVVAKLSDPPTEAHPLLCDITAGGEANFDAIALPRSPLWIPHAGFSADFQKVFVYVENRGVKPIDVQLLTAGDFDMVGRTRRMGFPVSPGDKGCLVGDLPTPLTAGQFVHVALGENTSGQGASLHRVVRAIHAVPIVVEHGFGDPSLGLDMQRPFTQTMACPAHAHGSPEEAAAEFLEDYARRFSDTPGVVIQMAICRANMPRAWFRFGDLADVAAMNPCLHPPSRYHDDPDAWFSPFFCVGDLAQTSTEPGRYLAIIPTGPDAAEGSLLLNGLSPQEWKFLVYSAMASGAKGVIYRGLPADDPLSRDAFRHVNRKLQRLRSLLSIAEPIEWATAQQSNYKARSLLCGDQAILIFIFDGRYLSRQRNGRFYTPPFGRSVSAVRIRVTIPDGMLIREVRTPFASLDPDHWSCQNDTLDLTAEMMDSAQVYVASLQWAPDPQKGGPRR